MQTDKPPAELPDRAAVAAAARRIAPFVRRTPLLRATLGGVTVWLKLEHTQLTGSFKVRGATNAVRSLPTGTGEVVAASGGNHGLGVAWAARAAGLRATVVVPETVPLEKARWLDELGADLVRHGAEYAEAEGHGRELAERRGLPFVHPFADPRVIAGQGTVAYELLEELDGRLDAVVVATGGGGLLAGTTAACEGSPVAAWGVEPVGVPTLTRALAAGEPVDVGVDSVTASALGARRTDPLTLALVRRAAGVVATTDERVLAARDLLWQSCRLAVEPAGAAALTAVLDGDIDAEEVCVVLCGANSAWRVG